MRKLIAVFLAIFVLFVFTSCREAEDKDIKTSTLPTEEIATENSYITAIDDDFDYLESVICGILRRAPDTSPIFDEYESAHEFSEIVRGISSPSVYENAYIYNSSSNRSR